MRTKREILKAALRGEKVEIPPPKIIVTKVVTQTDEEAQKIAAPKVEAAKRHYYKTYKPGDEVFPIMIMTFDTPFDYMTYGDEYKKFKNNEK